MKSICVERRKAEFLRKVRAHLRTHGRTVGLFLRTGKNLTLGIDIDLQMLGERLLQHKIGAIVAIEPATGEILCMVSSPTLTSSDRAPAGKNHRLLQMDKRKPLLNRAIMGAYPPGSTFKTAQALTFLHEGIIHEDYPTFLVRMVSIIKASWDVTDMVRLCR